MCSGWCNTKKSKQPSEQEGSFPKDLCTQLKAAGEQKGSCITRVLLLEINLAISCVLLFSFSARHLLWINEVGHIWKGCKRAWHCPCRQNTKAWRYTSSPSLPFPCSRWYEAHKKHSQNTTSPLPVAGGTVVASRGFLSSRPYCPWRTAAKLTQAQMNSTVELSMMQHAIIWDNHGTSKVIN